MSNTEGFNHAQIAAAAKWWHDFLAAQLQPHMNKWHNGSVAVTAEPAKKPWLSRLFGLFSSKDQPHGNTTWLSQFYLSEGRLDSFRQELEFVLLREAQNPDLPRARLSGSRYINIIAEGHHLPVPVNHALSAAGLDPQTLVDRLLRKFIRPSGTCLHDNGLLCVMEKDDPVPLPYPYPDHPADMLPAFASVSCASAFPEITGAQRTLCLIFEKSSGARQMRLTPVARPFQADCGDNHVIVPEKGFIATELEFGRNYFLPGDQFDSLKKSGKLFILTEMQLS